MLIFLAFSLTYPDQYLISGEFFFSGISCLAMCGQFLIANKH